MTRKMDKRTRISLRTAINDIRERMSESGATAHLGRLPDASDCYKWAISKGLVRAIPHQKALIEYGDKIRATRNTKAARTVKSKRQSRGDFYLSWEWKKARFETLKRYGAVCMLCGSKDRIVVDHIKPRSRFPQFELDPDNLQVLCNDCNMGKSNDDYTDFRPQSVDEVAEMEILEEALNRIH